MQSLPPREAHGVSPVSQLSSMGRGKQNTRRHVLLEEVDLNIVTAVVDQEMTL